MSRSRCALLLAAYIVVIKGEIDSNDPYANMGYDTVATEDSAAQRVTQKFEQMDADGDGYLTVKEVAAREVAATKVVVEREFAVADADSNGQATREEMFDEKNLSRAEELFVFTSGQAEEKFAFADSNQDQALDLTEFFVFRHPRDSSREEEWVRLQVQQLLERMKMKEIAFTDFYNMDTQGLDLNAMAKEQPFDSVDRNKSGSLDEDELVLLFMLPQEADSVTAQFQYLASLANHTTDIRDGQGQSLSLQDCLNVPHYCLHMLHASTPADLHTEL